MKVMEEPKVECIMLTDSVDTAACSNDFECTTEYCNLQGCPKDECPSFVW